MLRINKANPVGNVHTGALGNILLGDNMKRIASVTFAVMTILALAWIVSGTIQPPYESFRGHYQALVQGDAPTGNGYGGTLIFDNNLNQLWVNGALPGQMGSNWFSTVVGYRQHLLSSYTDTSSTNFQAITGLSFSIPAGLARNVPVDCHIQFTQATQVADTFGVVDSVAPTSIDGYGILSTSGVGAPTLVYGTLAGLATTTATAIVSGTPTVATANFVDLHFLVQQPSGTSAATITIEEKQATAADVIVNLKGSYCSQY